jgi:hypothetical protein
MRTDSKSVESVESFAASRIRTSESTVMDSSQASSSAASAGRSPWDEDARQIQRRRSVAVMKGGRDLRFATEESRASKVASDIVGQAHHIIFYSKLVSDSKSLTKITKFCFDFVS